MNITNQITDTLKSKVQGRFEPSNKPKRVIQGNALVVDFNNPHKVEFESITDIFRAVPYDPMLPPRRK
jgi:hypothetical protein